MGAIAMGIVGWFGLSLIMGPLIGKCLSGYRGVPRVDPPVVPQPFGRPSLAGANILIDLT
ncbi:MAG TPA: hypothetical protein VGH10_10670 [Actinomycetota bacterium]|jgi:hypothetical protein